MAVNEIPDDMFAQTRYKNRQEELEAMLDPELREYDRNRLIEAIEKFDIPSIPNFYFTKYVENKGQHGARFLVRNVIDDSRWCAKFLRHSELGHEQDLKRRIDALQEIKREARRGKKLDTTHIPVTAPSMQASNGEPVYLEEPFSRFLDEFLGERREHRMMPGDTFVPMDELSQIALGITAGLAAAHSHELVHSDLHAGNIAYEGHYSLPPTVKICDWGTSTLAFASHDYIRDNMGAAFIRAPENFKPGSHPTKQSDVYSVGALIFKMFKGGYPFEYELQGDINFFSNIDSDDYSRMMKTKLKEIPRRYRGIVKKCLDLEPSKRYFDAQLLHEDLKGVDRLVDPKKIINYIKSMGIALPVAAFVGFGLYAGFMNQPTSIDLPVKVVHGDVYLGDRINPGQKIDMEVLDHPAMANNSLLSPRNQMIQHATHNLLSYYLACAQTDACHQLGSIDVVSEYQSDLFGQVSIGKIALVNSTPNWLRAQVMSIEHAMNVVHEIKGYHDLEDEIVVSRIGQTAWQKARDSARAVNPEQADNYSVYREFLPKGNLRFIDLAIGYANRYISNQIQMSKDMNFIP